MRKPNPTTYTPKMRENALDSLLALGFRLVAQDESAVVLRDPAGVERDLYWTEVPSFAEGVYSVLAVGA